MKYYIVQELGTSYNDEVYSLEEGGKPQKVFTDKKEAISYLDEKNFKAVSSQNIFEYGYEPSEVLRDVDKFVDTYNALFKEQITVDDLGYEFEFPKLTKAEYLALKPFIGISFFEVVECD